ncbi:hypothetical protein LO763_14495 [Glycomyces sp. A-F 0318]|uniref:hypothetical protein n=1 Tax=Glycomyces amatae TaxID=2881355 RepID=UPI001E46EF06|nr:hypothetical protein [Glycomyces amatae]MCD0444824.1 hypothetical protein [Glycomyces amatae]
MRPAADLRRPRTAGRRARFALAAAALAILPAACSNPKGPMETAPPESAYTQAEAYAPMEAAAAEAVAALPDFPGFEQRSWAEMPCSRGGVDDPDYTRIEIRYRFSLPDSGAPLVRERYVELLRDHWTGLGYEITADDAVEGGERTDRNLVALREDGISLWYAVGGYAGLFIDSGCVPVSDAGDIEYVPPTGGVAPGGPGDLVGDYFPEGVPAAREAVAPFEPPADYGDHL